MVSTCSWLLLLPLWHSISEETPVARTDLYHPADFHPPKPEEKSLPPRVLPLFLRLPLLSTVDSLYPPYGPGTQTGTKNPALALVSEFATWTIDRALFLSSSQEGVGLTDRFVLIELILHSSIHQPKWHRSIRTASSSSSSRASSTARRLVRYVVLLPPAAILSRRVTLLDWPPQVDFGAVASELGIVSKGAA